MFSHRAREVLSPSSSVPRRRLSDLIDQYAETLEPLPQPAPLPPPQTANGAAWSSSPERVPAIVLPRLPGDGEGEMGGGLGAVDDDAEAASGALSTDFDDLLRHMEKQATSLQATYHKYENLESAAYPSQVRVGVLWMEQYFGDFVRLFTRPYLLRVGGLVLGVSLFFYVLMLPVPVTVYDTLHEPSPPPSPGMPPPPPPSPPPP